MDDKNIQIGEILSDEAEEALEVDADVNDKVDMFPLHHGGELLSSETYDITASEKSKLIAVLGATGSGKTSLITSMYQQFLQEERLIQHYFSGSMTLNAFEQRSYNTRITSNRSEAQMERTQRGKENRILHLRVMNLDNMSKQNLLLADYSGEDYEAISADIHSAKEEFQLIRSAKYIILLLDGEKIASSKFRLMEIQKAIHLLRTFIDAKLLYKNAQILIVISKMDIVRETEKEGKPISTSNCFNTLLKQLPELTDCTTLYEVAAMPKNDEFVEIGYGIDKLFSYIANPISLRTELPPPSPLFSQFNLWERRKH